MLVCRSLPAVAVTSISGISLGPVSDQAVRGPERAYYQRLRGYSWHGGYTKVASNGELTLTTSAVVFRSRIGRVVTVALHEISDVRARAIGRSVIHAPIYVARTQLVVSTTLGEVGFNVKDAEGWADAVRRQHAAANGD